MLFIYLASKCLANRIKLVISSIVSETQQAFVPSRLMSDGCLITHEIMHYLNKTTKGTVSYAALKLDMHKAFDRVSWPFLMAILKKFGFPIFWQNIIWESNPASFESLRDLFRCFELASGQMINLDKSFIKFSPNAPPDFKSYMASILKMKTSDCFGNYLGVPVDLPSKKSLVFRPLVDKMTSRVIAWSSLHLSQPCKLIIINSILLGSICFLLASIPFPTGICKKIDSLIIAFWWRKDVRHRSIHWLSRDSLQLPREHGGLGLKFVALLSQASLMTNFWRLHHQPSGILAKYMIPKYRKDLPIPAAKSKVSRPSFVWSGICRAASVFSPGLSWKLGNGSSVDLFTSRWVNGSTPSLRPSSTASSFVLSDLLTISGVWDHFAVFRFFTPSCAKVIIAMEPPHINIDDFLYWKYTEDGVYTVRSGYDYLMSQSSFSCSPSFYSAFPWKILWGVHSSTKLPLLVWRIIHNILPSLENLFVRGIQVSTSCVFCHSQTESLDHLFRTCTVTRHVWLLSSLGLNSVANPTICLQRWIADLICYFHRFTDSTDQCLLRFLCIFKAIWMVRNSVVFDNCSVNPSQIFHLSDYILASLSQLPVFWPSYSKPHNNFAISTLDYALPYFSVTYLILVCRAFSRDQYIVSSSDTTCCTPALSLVRASSLFAASTKGLLITMYRAHSASLPSVSFRIASKKLSSVLASTKPVPIELRHSLSTIRCFLRMYALWSVSLDTG
ncbi:uncharacterized protein LOC141588658 [Silene latifolia]|uniref:uncharacterized protein LOC141588658 n=1 Tax=Silene latifolia TaxID=37657 RepID=UPI003D775886